MIQDESRDRALKRIKKCLALSDSANENEAAIALKQAHALMRQFNLTQAGVLASKINRVHAKAGAMYRPSRWDKSLVACIAHQFDCQALILKPRHAQVQWVFLGEDQAPEIAAYAYEVLYRQLLAAKDRFIASRYSDVAPGQKRKLGTLFCVGWVDAVWTTVEAFANADAPQQSEALLAYMREHHPSLKEDKARVPKRRVSPTEYDAYRVGVQQGETAKLHRGVGGAKQTLIGHDAVGVVRVHPGRYLLEEIIKPLNQTVEQFAARIAATAGSLAEVVSGRSGVTEELAVKLETAGFSTRRFWLALQVEYDAVGQSSGAVS